MEPIVSKMLPGNVIVRDLTCGVEINANNPLASIPTIDRPKLRAVAGKVHDLLVNGLASI